MFHMQNPVCLSVPHNSFGFFEREYLSEELQPLLETLKEVEGIKAGGSSTATAFTRKLEEVNESWCG